MAEETEGRGGRSIRVDRVSANRAYAKDVQVERLHVNTGEAQDGSTDLLNEVRSAITDQTKTLLRSLDIIEDIAQQQLNVLKRGSSQSQSQNPFAQNLTNAVEEGTFRALSRMGLSPAASAGGGGGIFRRPPPPPPPPPPGGGSSGSSGSGGGNMNDQFERLIKTLEALAVERAIPEGGAGGEGHGSGGLSFGDAAVLPRLFEATGEFTDSIIKSNERFIKLGKLIDQSNNEIEKLVGSGILMQVETNIREIGQTIQSFGTNLTNLDNITRTISDKFSSSLEMATSGAVNLGEAFIDFIPGIIRGGDNLADTFKTVRASMDANLISPIGTMGADLAGVSETLMSARSFFRDQGTNALERMNWSDFNESMIGLYALERRRDVTASMDDIRTRQRISTQFDFYQTIATNTGKTADEVIKLNQQYASRLRNLEAGGVLQGAEREGMEKAIGIFANTPGMEPFAELLAGIARAGGNTNLFLSQNDDWAQSLAATGQIGNVNELVATALGGASANPADLANALNAIAGRMNVNPFTGVAGSTVISDSAMELFGAAGLSRTMTPDEEPDMIQKGIRYLGDVFSNYLPSAEMKLVAALMLNTAALGINTVALTGGGMVGRMFSGAAGLTGKLFRRKMPGGIGGVDLMGARSGADMALKQGIMGSAGKAGAGAAAGLGSKILSKKLPFGIGLAAALAFAADRAMGGDFVGAGLEAASGAASIVPGIGTAASLGIDGLLAARDLTGGADAVSSEIAAVGPSATKPTATTNQGIRTETQRLLVRNNQILESILSQLEGQTDLQEDIKRNTGRAAATASSGFLDRIFGDSEAESYG